MPHDAAPIVHVIRYSARLVILVTEKVELGASIKRSKPGPYQPKLSAAS